MKTASRTASHVSGVSPPDSSTTLYSRPPLRGGIGEVRYRVGVWVGLSVRVRAGVRVSPTPPLDRARGGDVDEHAALDVDARRVHVDQHAVRVRVRVRARVRRGVCSSSLA